MQLPFLIGPPSKKNPPNIQAVCPIEKLFQILHAWKSAYLLTLEYVKKCKLEMGSFFIFYAW